MIKTIKMLRFMPTLGTVPLPCWRDSLFVDLERTSRSTFEPSALITLDNCYEYLDEAGFDFDFDGVNLTDQLYVVSS